MAPKTGEKEESKFELAQREPQIVEKYQKDFKLDDAEVYRLRCFFTREIMPDNLTEKEIRMCIAMHDFLARGFASPNFEWLKAVVGRKMIDRGI